MKQVKGRFERFAPRIRNKETGEVSTVGFMNYRYDGTIYNASDGHSYDSMMREKGNTDNWKDINEIELLIPTGLYDDNEEMIYVASFEELHELIIKNHEHIKIIHGETPYVPFFEREHEND